MSLEKTLEENTAAIKELTLQLSKGEATATTEVKKKPATKKKAETKVPKIDYDKEVKAPTIALAKLTDRETVQSILDGFGTDLKTAKDLEEGQWAEYSKAVKAAIAEAEDEDDLA